MRAAFGGGDLFLKPVDDHREAAWIQDLAARLAGAEVRVPEPVATADGRWVHDGWIAFRFVPGLRPLAPDWDAVIEVGLRFGDAADAVAGPPDVLARRTHRWAVADRVAWGEEEVTLERPAAGALLARLRSLVDGDRTGDSGIDHGDLAGNVFLDGDGEPLVLDISPYVRPRRWAAAVVTADAVLWHGAELSRAAAFDDRDLLARALVYRMVAEQLAVDPRHGALLEPYEAVLTVLQT